MTRTRLLRAARLIGAGASFVVCIAGLAFVAQQTVMQPQREPLPVFAAQPSALVPVTPSPAVQTPAPAPVADPTASSRVDETWLTRTAAKAGIPVPALRAYADAQLSAPPVCDIGWTTLAGIGWIESQHGTLDGRTVTDGGYSSTPIVGPALDGDPYAAIPATPQSSQWHGDPTWDHAVGPMQFIPSTWRTWGTDGDGDGVADPNDLDDAARTAVAYLCADGHDLTSGEGWSNAIFGYNHDASYVANVHNAASTYAERTR